MIKILNTRKLRIYWKNEFCDFQIIEFDGQDNYWEELNDEILKNNDCIEMTDRVIGVMIQSYVGK